MPSLKGLSLEVVKDPFFKIRILFTLFIALPFCKLSFYYKLAEVPGVARGILKIELRKI